MKYNILIVEDDPINMEIYKDMLGQHYNVTGAGNMEEALAFLDKSIPHILLLDLLLPDCNGSELCLKLKNNLATRHIPIIVVTSLSHPGEKIKVLEAGANDFLTKPVDKKELFLKIENHLTIQKQYARIQEQKREISQFVEMMVHDLKGPLTVIKGYSELIEDFSRDPFTQEHINKINNSSEKMLAAINRILDIKTIEEAEFNINIENIDIAIIIDKFIEQCQNVAAKKKISLSSISSNGKIHVAADQAKLRVVLENLVGNAIKFSPSHKAIEIETLNLNEEFIKVQVKDQGLGLNRDDMEAAFREVRKLSARPTGNEHSTGLGLVIVRRFIEMMGGEVGVESPGKNMGATFWFTLKKANI